jgi:multidrug resistance efflux pump
LTDYSNDFNEKARSEYKNLSNEIDMLTERIRNIFKTINNFEIKSPQSGTVLNITKNRVGNIFSANEILLEIVPDDEEIVVIANLSTRDNYHISVNQNAVIRLSTHNQSFAPEFEGVVSSISPDVKIDNPNEPPSFQLTVKFPCDAQCKELYKMTSGMPADIYLLGNKRSLISYLLDAIYSGSRNVITD